MIIPKIAIEKAISGGWQPLHDGSWSPSIMSYSEAGTWITDRIAGEHATFFNFEKIALDPTFWQALGKALRWPRSICRECGEPNGCKYGRPNFMDAWEYFAHRLYHLLLLTKQDTTAFWQELLGEKIV